MGAALDDIRKEWRHGDREFAVAAMALVTLLGVLALALAAGLVALTVHLWTVWPPLPVGLWIALIAVVRFWMWVVQ